MNFRVLVFMLMVFNVASRVNVSLGPNEDRYLMTGMHTVNDIYCSCCQKLLGWRYVSYPLFICFL
jgi:hypothetical protein